MNPNCKPSLTNGEMLIDDSQHKRLIGRLSYLTICRLDIAFIVNKLSQFMLKYKIIHVLLSKSLSCWIDIVHGIISEFL